MAISLLSYKMVSFFCASNLLNAVTITKRFRIARSRQAREPNELTLVSDLGEREHPTHLQLER
jgi:hypothetical protein